MGDHSAGIALKVVTIGAGIVAAIVAMMSIFSIFSFVYLLKYGGASQFLGQVVKAFDGVSDGLIDTCTVTADLMLVNISRLVIQIFDSVDTRLGNIGLDLKSVETRCGIATNSLDVPVIGAKSLFGTRLPGLRKDFNKKYPLST